LAAAAAAAAAAAGGDEAALAALGREALAARLRVGAVISRAPLRLFWVIFEVDLGLGLAVATQLVGVFVLKSS